MGEHSYEKLKSILRSCGQAAVAYSGGVDSTFLAKVGHDVLGANCVAITISSALLPKSELDRAEETARAIGIAHYVIRERDLEPGVAENPPDRCYRCKKIEFALIKQKAAELGIAHVLDGSNVDDLSDFRPGRRALQELGISSPLCEAGLTKAEIRELSKTLGLPTWNRPAAACLASRIPYGERITDEKLLRIERAEDFLRDMGFVRFRVRSHDHLARIEVAPEERAKMWDAEKMDRIAKALKSFGFLYVAVDLEGYRTGSLNEALQAVERKP